MFKSVVSFVEKLFLFVVGFIWVIDILDFPQVAFLDTECPINFWAWVLIHILLQNVFYRPFISFDGNGSKANCSSCKYKKYYEANIVDVEYRKD